MLFIRRFKIRSYEMGLLFRDEEFERILPGGSYWFFDPFGKIRVDIVSRRAPWLSLEKLDVVVKSGQLGEHATVFEVKDDERALVWIDGRFAAILTAGQYAYWMGFRKVSVEVVNVRNPRFEHADQKAILRSQGQHGQFEIHSVPRDHVGIMFIDGRYVETVSPGIYAFWRGMADVRVVEVDLREKMIDVAGQDVMTADKVTLRLNAVATYRVTDARKSISLNEDARNALYREVQFALRAVVGSRELDGFLAEKDAVAKEIEDAVRRRAVELGLELASVGIRDVILPGEMKDLMNKVTEAKKAAEANLISRREETAAIRSQANTAKLLADNPVLMRLRELEVLEKIAGGGKLSVVLGEKGLADRVMNLL